MVVTGGSTNTRNLTVQEGVTYTVSIQTFSSTELPSAIVEVRISQQKVSSLLTIARVGGLEGYFNGVVV